MAAGRFIPEDLFDLAFNFADMDNDGSVSMEEIGAMEEVGRDLDLEWAHGMWHTFDKDYDYHLNFEEYSNAINLLTLATDID